MKSFLETQKDVFDFGVDVVPKLRHLTDSQQGCESVELPQQKGRGGSGFTLLYSLAGCVLISYNFFSQPMPSQLRGIAASQCAKTCKNSI